MECKVAKLLTRFGVENACTKGRGDVPNVVVEEIDISTDLELGRVVLLGKEVHNLTTKVGPLLGVSKDVIPRVGMLEAGIIVKVDLFRVADTM